MPVNRRSAKSGQQSTPLRFMRVAFIHNRYIDYRRPLFELISKEFNTTFFFEYEWQKTKTVGRSSFSLPVFPPRRPAYRFSPALPLKLIFGKFDIYLAGDIGLPNTYLTGWIARIKRKPFIVWSEEWHPPWYLQRKQFACKRKLVNAADACVASGTKAKEFYQFLGVEEKKIFIAPDVSITQAGDNCNYDLKDAGINIKKDSLIILYLGRLIKRKGAHYLIEAFSRIEQEVDKVVLIIAGEGPFLNHIKRIIENHKLEKVIVTGQKADDLAKGVLYSNCSIFVVPSVYDSSVEPWGLVLNEAMYFGKPVIATDMVGGAFDLINNGVNGFIVPEKDADALYRALQLLIVNVKLREKMGVESKKIIISRFDWSHMLQGFQNAIVFAVKNYNLRCSRTLKNAENSIIQNP